MDNFIVLMVAALVSLHQYLPEDSETTHKYYNNVEQMQRLDILPAANQSCLYLYNLSKTAGIETFGADGALGIAAGTLLEQGDGLGAALSLLESDAMAEKLESRGLNPSELKNFFTRLCNPEFDPYSLPQDLESKVEDFLKNEIQVLDQQDIHSLGNFQVYGGVEVYDSQLQPVGIQGVMERKWTPYNEIGHGLFISLLAAEDEQFFSHDGVNTLSVARIIKEALSSDSASGGSTVTMQLLKNLYFDNWKPSEIAEYNQGQLEDVLRKVREWYWSKSFEQNFKSEQNPLAHKEKVLELYFNLVNFGLGVQGIHQASQFYFGKRPKNLSVAESAYLVSLLKRPAFYSEPENYLAWTKPRRDDYIINRIVEICQQAGDQARPQGALKLIDLCKSTDMDSPEEEEIASIKSEPLPLWRPYELPQVELAESDLPEASPIAVNFTASLTQGSADSESTTEAHIPFLRQADKVVQRIVTENPGMHKELKVKTTMDSELQKIVYSAVRDKLDAYDRERSSSRYIRPANDDRGQRARLRKEDLGFRFLYNIDRFTTKHWRPDYRLLFNVTLSAARTKEITLELASLESAFISVGLSEEASDKAQDVLRQLLSNSRDVGQVDFVEITPEGGRVLSPQEVLASLDLSESEAEEFREYYSTGSVGQNLIQNSLNRLNRYKQRKDLDPIVRTEEGEFLTTGGRSVELSSSSRQRASELSQGKTTFFWGEASGEDGSSYSLAAPKLQAAVLVVDSQTGKVLANFAGYEAEAAFFDRSLEMQRQYGSALKPWVYYLALENGLSLSTTLINSYVEFPYANGTKTYRPRNFSSGTTTHVSLQNAMISSYNIATYSLLKTPGWDGELHWRERFNQLRSLLEDVGIYEETENQIPVVLGAQVSTLQKLVDSYTYFSNGSEIKKSYMVEGIEDYFGNTLYQHQPESIGVPSRRSYSLRDLQEILAKVANRGTAARLRNFTRQLSDGRFRSLCFNGEIGSDYQTCFGGKTGTSNDGRDTWFMGLSKNFVIGVWVGYDDFQAIPGSATGGQLALPIFMDIVEQGIDHLPEVAPFVTSGGFRSLSDGNFNISTESLWDQDSNFEPSGGALADRCFCQRVTNESGLTLGYRIVSRAQPNFISEIYNYVGECMMDKSQLVSQGSLRCQ